MNYRNVATTVKFAYPKQSYDLFLSAPTNQQLLVHSIEAVNNTAASNDLAVAYSQNPDQVTAVLVGNNYVISSKNQFDLIAFSIVTAESGGVTFTYQYWNGSTWVALVLVNTPVLTATGCQVLLFNAPLDWALDSNDVYSIRIVGSATPNYNLGTPKACRTLSYRENVLPSASLQIDLTDTRSLLLQQGEGLIGFFAFPSASNTMEASYQINP